MNDTPPPASAPDSDKNDPWLEKLIRAAPPGAERNTTRDAAAFTARVMGALPPLVAPSERHNKRRRTLMVGVATALGCSLAVVAGSSDLAAGLADLTTLLSHPATVPALAAVGVVVSLVLVSGGSLRRLI